MKSPRALDISLFLKILVLHLQGQAVAVHEASYKPLDLGKLIAIEITARIDLAGVEIHVATQEAPLFEGLVGNQGLQEPLPGDGDDAEQLRVRSGLPGPSS